MDTRVSQHCGYVLFLEYYWNRHCLLTHHSAPPLLVEAGCWLKQVVAKTMHAQELLPCLEELNGQPLAPVGRPPASLATTLRPCALAAMAWAPAGQATWNTNPAVPAACRVLLQHALVNSQEPPLGTHDCHAAGTLEWLLQRQDVELHALRGLHGAQEGLVAMHHALTRHAQALLTEPATALQVWQHVHQLAVC